MSASSALQRKEFVIADISRLKILRPHERFGAMGAEEQNRGAEKDECGCTIRTEVRGVGEQRPLTQSSPA